MKGGHHGLCFHLLTGQGSLASRRPPSTYHPEGFLEETGREGLALARVPPEASHRWHFRQAPSLPVLGFPSCPGILCSAHRCLKAQATFPKSLLAVYGPAPFKPQAGGEDTPTVWWSFLMPQGCRASRSSD